MVKELPVLGVCGWSGSGKTTLVEAVLPRLVELNLKVAVVKHDVHGINVDRPGKDSDRFFRAGADVFLQGDQELWRLHSDSGIDLISRLKVLCARYDLVLVEGHKLTPLPKIWLLSEGEDKPPALVSGVMATYARDSKRVEKLMEFLTGWLPRQWLKTPVFGCIVIGDPGGRQGRSKDRFQKDESTRLKLLGSELRKVTKGIVITGGNGLYESPDSCTYLPTAPDLTGPLAGLLTAMRWNPMVSWIVVNHTGTMSVDTWQWLLSTRAPGAWAILPKLGGNKEARPFLAYFDFRSYDLLEQLVMQNVFDSSWLSHQKFITPSPPANLEGV